mgnify:CR=1 FL=1
MNPELNLNLKQHQTQRLNLTQQLQQSIALLQKNQEELTEFVVEKAMENPLVEVIRPIAPVEGGNNLSGTS